MTYPPLTNPRLRPAVEALTPPQREDFEERAGILEYCCDMPRAEAEALALRQVRNPAR